MSTPKSPKQELPWYVFAACAGICFISSLLTMLNVLDFSDKPGVKRGLLVIFTGLHEIAGPFGPAIAFALFGLYFSFTARSSYRKQK